MLVVVWIKGRESSEIHRHNHTVYIHEGTIAGKVLVMNVSTTSLTIVLYKEKQYDYK